MSSTAVHFGLRKRKPAVQKKGRDGKRIKVRQATKGKPGMTITKVQKKRKQFNDKSVGDLVVNRVANGRAPKHTLAQAWKMLAANIRRNVYYVEQVNRFMTSNGGMTMLNSYTGSTIGSGSVYLPLHLYSLSCAPNQINGSTISPAAQYYLQRTGTSGQMTFGSFSSYNPLTTDTFNSTTGIGAAQSLPGTNDILKGSKIKMVLYGTVTRPVQFRIDLVQIMKPTDHPDYIQSRGNLYSTTGTAGNDEQANEVNAATAFYEELVRPFAFSPATFSNGDAVKGRIKFLKTWTHVIDPRLSTEAADVVASASGGDSIASVPHTHVFDIWQQWNRSQRYDWERTNAQSENTGSSEVTPTVEMGDVRTDVTPAARVYLMVRAYAQISTVNSQFDVGCHPSYDLSIRNYHESLN